MMDDIIVAKDTTLLRCRRLEPKIRVCRPAPQKAIQFPLFILAQKSHEPKLPLLQHQWLTNHRRHRNIRHLSTPFSRVIQQGHFSTNLISTPGKIQLTDLSSTPSLNFFFDSRFVNRSTAEYYNLISESDEVVFISSDSKNISPSGRKSIRLESKDDFHEVLIIADFVHLPRA